LPQYTFVLIISGILHYENGIWVFSSNIRGTQIPFSLYVKCQKWKKKVDHFLFCRRRQGYELRSLGRRWISIIYK